MIATTTVKTATPSKYINRLCKHFAHKVTVQYDDDQGEVLFDMGKGLIAKTADGLIMTAEADTQENLATVVDILDRHFVRVAWQEELTLSWTKASV